jgi:hypothetical protein
MFLNLIQSQSIDPFQFSRHRLLTDAAQVLRIAEERIENVVPYAHQLWVNIKGVGGKFVSYRRLQVWWDAAVSAIKECPNLQFLRDLGAIFKYESQKYQKYYDEKILKILRNAWDKKQIELHQEQRRIELAIAHRQEAQQWRSIWTDVINHCSNREFLKYTISEIHRQKQQFTDLPDLVESVERICLKRWEELTRSAVG